MHTPYFNGGYENQNITMPNKRDPNKERISFYIDRRVKEVAQYILELNGSTLTEYLNVKIYELLEKREDEILKRLAEFDGRTKKGKARIRAEKNSES